MKKLIFAALLLMMFAPVAIAQNQEASGENENHYYGISYDDLQTWERSKNGYYTSYLSRDGHVYHVGDKLTFGETSDGKTYRYMWERENALHILGEVPTLPISTQWVGKTGVIKNIIVSGNKKRGHDIMVVLAVGGLSRIEVFPFDMAIASGEIISQGKTKELALKELKEAKDMLDLGLITEAEFNAKKAELSKFILKK